MAGHRRRQTRLPGRRPPVREPRKIILIVCEGAKTEPNYFKSLRKEWRLTTAEIEVVGVGETPGRVVDRAVKLRNERRRRARKETYEVGFDEVWCVFDRDIHADYAEALKTAAREKIRVAPSTPCFEFWYLLHFAFTTRPFRSFDDLKPELERHLPGYSKAVDCFDGLFPHLGTALENAEAVRKHNDSSGADRPATDVDRLVQELRRIQEGV